MPSNKSSYTDRWPREPRPSDPRHTTHSGRVSSRTFSADEVAGAAYNRSSSLRNYRNDAQKGTHSATRAAQSRESREFRPSRASCASRESRTSRPSRTPGSISSPSAARAPHQGASRMAPSRRTGGAQQASRTHNREGGHARMRSGTRDWEQVSAASSPHALSLKEKMLSSRPFLIACALVAIVLVACVADFIMNWDRAYGNIFIQGVNVSGMNSAEMRQALQDEVGTQLSHAQVSIYADEAARERMLAALAAAEEVAQGSQAFNEAEQVEVDYWMTDAHTLKASLGYDDAIARALDVGRSDGGILRRMALTFQPVEIELELSIDEREVENLAAQIDEAIGTPRQDTTVQISRAWATVVEGRSGVLIDRSWLDVKLREALMSESLSSSFLAELRDAPSRITRAQAEKLCEQLNHALGCDALFIYEDNRFAASDIDLGDWTRVDVVALDNDGSEDANESAEAPVGVAASSPAGFELKPSIDASRAIAPIVEGADARVKSDDTHASFEKTDEGIMVGLSGTGYMPEVSAAVERLNQELYGTDGFAYTTKAPTTIEIEIGETDKPDSLALNQALSLGLVTVVGEFTTEFSNYVGTENRNHNIKLAADLLNNGIIKANGGIWSFNDESGNTNEEAGFWSAGSIVDGVITDSIGGGICQVATTIFNAVYEAGLYVAERHNHTIYMANYPDGRDAAVSYPDIDLVWRNDLTSDILLTLSYTDTTITCRLYSVYTGYRAETITGAWQEGAKFSMRFEEDASLAKDVYRLKSEGKDGRKITIERLVYNDDNLVLFNDSFGSLYDPEDEIYLVGSGTDTKKLEQELQEKKDAEKKAEEEAEAAKAKAEAEAEVEAETEAAELATRTQTAEAVEGDRVT